MAIFRRDTANEVVEYKGYKNRDFIPIFRFNSEMIYTGNGHSYYMKCEYETAPVLSNGTISMTLNDA